MNGETRLMMNPNSGLFGCIYVKNYLLGTWKALWESEEAKPHRKQFHAQIESHWEVGWVEGGEAAQDGLFSLGELGSATGTFVRAGNPMWWG